MNTMIRVFGQQLNPSKVAEFELLKVYGIGRTRAAQICRALDISNTTRVKELPPEYQNKIQDKARELGFVVADDLRRQLLIADKARIAIKCFRAIRARMGLPCRGQRTRSNANTARRLRKKL